MRLSRFLLYLAAVAAAVVFRLAYVGWFGPYLVAAVAAVPLLLFLLSLPSMRALRLSLSAPALPLPPAWLFPPRRLAVLRRLFSL